MINYNPLMLWLTVTLDVFKLNGILYLTVYIAINSNIRCI